MEHLVDGRCGWCEIDELYVQYHDTEWGRLVTDDQTLFESLKTGGLPQSLLHLSVARH